MTHKIMVVEDNSVTRRMVGDALRRNGHDVLEAPDGKTAREMMRREHPRVVLQDLMLPDADGFELVGELRDLAEGTDVSILAFSGFVSELDEGRAATVGFDDIIAKPIAPSRLVPLIEAHLPAPEATSASQFGTGKRVVLADDDPMQLKLASLRLARLGFDVEAVSHGRAALEAVRRKHADAIVSDVMMPELDGFGVALAIRQDPLLRDLPVVLVTSSYVEAADRDLARRAGATDLVPRTPELGEMLDALRASLVRHVSEVTPESVPALEREHNQRVFRQLERQVRLNHGLAKRCSVLSSELAVLTGISAAVLEQRPIDVALDEAIAECFDAGGISHGALYLAGPDGSVRVRPIGEAAAVDELATLWGHQHVLERTLRDGKMLERAPASLLDRARATAIVMVPFLHPDRVLGALLMVARGRELDHDDWLVFARGVAMQISHVLSLAGAYAAREEAERRATAHAAVLDALVENAPDLVMQVDLEGIIRFSNRPGHAVGASVLAGDANEHRDAMRAAFDRMKATGVAQGFEAASSGETWYSTRLGPIFERGTIVGAVIVSRDTTDKKQAEVHLALADRMASVGTLAAGVAHEINNPLTSVIANLDIALQRLSENETDIAGELEDARLASERVREIVRDLKIFSRANEAEHRGPVDVEQVLESTIRMAWNEIRHRARITRDYQPVPHVEANDSRIGQVFLNLLINAAHAIAPGNYDANEIRISTSLVGGRVVVAIRDTGAGIPADVRPRLFTPFFTTKPIGVGTGLGLAISHRIISEFGGTIVFESELGRGTEFRVTLPAATRPVEQPVTIPLRTIPARRRGTVLVVDDETSLANTLRRFLSSEHDVTAVHSGDDALELIRAGKRYDVILCDLMMPQVTGMAVHAEIETLDPAQAERMVFLTGGAFTVAAREFLDTITNPHLEKPFDLAELRKVVNDTIG